ncbi:MAG: amidase family protein, partial [Solirubrobacteraceae bacterium]
AQRVRSGDADGSVPLAGVPFLLKDLGEPQAGLPERMGSRALRDHVATETAWTVRRYEAAGLNICGRTNTAEYPHGRQVPAEAHRAFDAREATKVVLTTG